MRIFPFRKMETLFVIDKPQFQRAISFARDDRTKANWGLDGPFMRLEAKDDYVKVDGLEASVNVDCHTSRLACSWQERCKGTIL